MYSVQRTNADVVEVYDSHKLNALLGRIQCHCNS